MSPIWIPSPPSPREINKHAHPVYTLRLQNDIEQFLLLSRPVVWTNAQSRVDFTSFTIRNSVEHLAPPILPRCVLYLRANKPYIRPIILVTERFLLAGTNVCPSVKLLSLSLSVQFLLRKTLKITYEKEFLFLMGWRGSSAISANKTASYVADARQAADKNLFEKRERANFPFQERKSETGRDDL